MPSIESLRTAPLTVRTTPGASVRIEQIRHAFAFGTAISARPLLSGDADSQRYQAIVRSRFSMAVHENELKWYHTERHQQGQIDYSSAERMYEWCSANGLTVRGHCIFWEKREYVQPWVQALDDATLRAVLERRAKEVTSRFRGRIREYDLNNEMVDGRFYRDRLGERIVDEMFAWARAGDPDAALWMNDYSILNGPNFDPYVAHIEQLLSRGVPIGGIGCQGHFNGPIDFDLLQRRLDRLAQFGLPIKVTEFDQDGVDDGQRARDLEQLYTTLFSHPAVNGILMWGFWEGKHWKPQTAIYRRDWTPTPAAEMYDDLVLNRWWTRTTIQADAAGAATARVFLGRHRVTVDGRSQEIDVLDRDAGVTVHLG